MSRVSVGSSFQKGKVPLRPLANKATRGAEGREESVWAKTYEKKDLSEVNTLK